MPETNKKDMNQAMQFDAIQIGLAKLHCLIHVLFICFWHL